MPRQKANPSTVQAMSDQSKSLQKQQIKYQQFTHFHHPSLLSPNLNTLSKQKKLSSTIIRMHTPQTTPIDCKLRGVIGVDAHDTRLTGTSNSSYPLIPSASKNTTMKLFLPIYTNRPNSVLCVDPSTAPCRPKSPSKTLMS